MKAWLVRGLTDENEEAKFLAENKVEIGFSKVHGTANLGSREELKAKIQTAYPEWPPGRVRNAVTCLWFFLKEISVDDFVLLPRKTDWPFIEIGRVKGECTELSDESRDAGFTRDVEWLGRAPRQDFSPEARRGLQNTMTVGPVLPTSEIEFLLDGSSNFPGSVVHASLKKNVHEKALHPFVVFWFYETLGIRLKTINHEKAKKNSFGEWVFPDMVGFSYPVDTFENSVLDLGMTIGSAPISLVSIEFKKWLGISNLRECYFQAVSNSSWANFGYLAATEIEDAEEFHAELGRLNRTHGIGVVRISLEDPTFGSVVFEPRYRPGIEWETVNKLAMMSPEFAKFLRDLKLCISNAQVFEDRFDRILDLDELAKLLT